MNILLLNYEYPPLGGGAGVVSEQLTKEFIDIGHSVTVITTWYKGEQEYFQDGNLTVVRLKSRRKKTYQSNPIEMASWMFAAIKYAKENPALKKHDICLTNFTLPGGWVSFKIKKMYGIPYVILSHAHDIPWYYKKKMFFWHFIFYWVIKYVCYKSEQVIVFSEQLKQYYADKFIGQEEKTVVIPNGLHLREKISKQFNLTMKILFIGRLVHQKDPFTFLKAINLLKNEKLNIEINILGDGNLKSSMEEFIIINKIENIHVKGKVSHLRVFEYLEEAHLLVSTSINEGMSVAILEAIASGVYVVASPVSGNREMIIENINGNIVDFQDYKQVAEKIKLFYFNNFLNNKTIEQKYIDEMYSRFSWSTIAKKYLALFNKILNKS